jgi:DNA-directed RNA polymerase subunit M/transcription elongation factor TFIIS
MNMTTESPAELVLEIDQYSVFRKLMALQRAIPVIPKDAHNEKMGFGYVSSSAVLKRIREAMDEIGLLLLFNVVHHEVIQGAAYRGQQALTVIDVEATWIDADNPSSRVTMIWSGQGADDGEKGIGKALTYMEKYNLLKCLHIPTDEIDPDADAPPDIENAPVCKKCGSVMSMRRGKRGPFWGCSAYPNCDYTMDIGEEEAAPRSVVYSSEEEPEEEVDLSEVWASTWEVVKQVRGENAGPDDPKTVKAMENWGKKYSGGEAQTLDEWPASMVLAFKASIDKSKGE